MLPDERDDWRERYEERASIMQYDGGLSRQDAERLARERVEHLMRERGIDDPMDPFQLSLFGGDEP